jgi:N-acetylmuramoyl-L-alanine amidase
MKRIAIQAGHLNTKQNKIEALRKSTGAPGEVEFTTKVVNRLAHCLSRTGKFSVVTTDANANSDPKITQANFDLFLSVHYDADIYGSGGGFIDFPEPSSDFSTTESQRITREMESQYFSHSGIANKPNRRNRNTKYYYMWRFLSASTPCVILECGVGQSPDDKSILSNTDHIVNAICRAIFKAFNEPYDPIIVQPDYKTFALMVRELAQSNMNSWTLKTKIRELITKMYIS